ncbi:MAG: tetratricopeptide repeat protein [Caldilineales bacterium]|nr:tetratricopeptide repeat protein [Caldilineales bacterium]
MTKTNVLELDSIIAEAGADLKSARKALRATAPNLPDDATTQTGLGLTYMALEQPRDAMRAFKHAVELDPNYPLARYHLGTLQTDTGLLPQGEENLRVAVDAEPDNGEYQAALGFNFYKAGKNDEAITTLQAAADAGVENEDIFASLGYLYYAAKRLQDSRAAFARAVELDPDYAEIYNNVGYLDLLLGDYESADPNFENCIAKDESFLRARYNLALSVWLQGDLERADELYKTARRLDRRDAELMQHLEDFDEVMEHHPEAEGLKDLRVQLAVAQKASRR